MNRLLIVLVILVSLAGSALSGAEPVQAWIVHNSAIRFCPPCERMKNDTKKFIKAKWRVGNDTDKNMKDLHIVLADAVDHPELKTESWPTTIFFRDGKEVARKIGYISPQVLELTFKAASK